MNPKVVVAILVVALGIGAGTKAQERGRGHGRRNQGNETTTDSPGRGRGHGHNLTTVQEVPANSSQGNETTTDMPGENRGQGRGHRGRVPFLFDLSRWNRTINGTDFAESGFVITNKSAVEVIAADPRLEELTKYSPAMFVYIFSNTTLISGIQPLQMMVIRPLSRFPICFTLTDEALPSLTFQEVADTVNSINNTMVSNITNTLLLNATEGPIDVTERDALFESNPALARFCGNRLIVHANLTTLGETVDPDANIVGYNALGLEIDLILPYRGSSRHPDVTTQQPAR